MKCEACGNDQFLVTTCIDCGREQDTESPRSPGCSIPDSVRQKANYAWNQLNASLIDLAEDHPSRSRICDAMASIDEIVKEN